MTVVFYSVSSFPFFRSRLVECSCDRRKLKSEIQNNKLNQQQQQSAHSRVQSKLQQQQSQNSVQISSNKDQCEQDTSPVSVHSRDEDKTAEERLLIDLRSPGDEDDAVRNPNWSEITIVDTDNTTDTQEDDKLR